MLREEKNAQVLDLLRLLGLLDLGPAPQDDCEADENRARAGERLARVRHQHVVEQQQIARLHVNVRVASA